MRWPIAGVGVLVALAEDAVASLPDPVRRGLERSRMLNLPVPDSVSVRQKGRIRHTRMGRWLGFVAQESYTLDSPTFEWNATLKAAGVGVGVGRATDSLLDGCGRMHVRLLGMLTVVDATGPEMDQGSLMRWLNETMWFPAVWATDAVAWEPVDDHRALGTVSIGGLEATAEFEFDDLGRLIDFRADRYRDVDDRFVMTPRSTPLANHRRFGEVELPSAGSAVWALDDGEFEYIHIEVADVRYVTRDP